MSLVVSRSQAKTSKELTSNEIVSGEWHDVAASLFIDSIWVREEDSSFVFKNSAGEGAEAGSGIMKIDWSNVGTSAGLQTSHSQITLENG